jgi:hypothetical protein
VKGIAIGTGKIPTPPIPGTGVWFLGRDRAH